MFHNEGLVVFLAQGLFVFLLSIPPFQMEWITTQPNQNGRHRTPTWGVHGVKLQYWPRMTRWKLCVCFQDVDDFFEHEKTFLLEYHNRVKDASAKSDKMIRSHKSKSLRLSPPPSISLEVNGLVTVDLSLHFYQGRHRHSTFYVWSFNVFLGWVFLHTFITPFYTCVLRKSSDNSYAAGSQCVWSWCVVSL